MPKLRNGGFSGVDLEEVKLLNKNIIKYAIENDIKHAPLFTKIYRTIAEINSLQGGTRLAKALAFASGMLAREQTMMDFGDDFKMQTLSSPKLCENLQLLILTSDGVSDDNFDEQAAILNERLFLAAAVVTKKFYREKLIPIVRYGDAIFTLAQIEALANWIWHQQKIRNEKFNGTGKGERTFQVSDLDLNNSKVNKTKKMNTTENYS